MKIHLAMIVKDEARCIGRCLRAAAPFVDEAHIADTGSTDGTGRILEEAGREAGLPIRRYRFAWTGDFSAARNFVLEKSEEAGADWHLVLDADEYLLSEACPEAYPKPAGEDVRQDRAALEAFIGRMERAHGQAFIGCIGQYHLLPPAGSGEQQLSFSPRILPRGCRYKGAIHELPDVPFPLIASPLRTEHDGYLNPAKPGRNLPYLEKALREHPEDAYYHYQLARTLAGLGRLPEAAERYGQFYRMLPPPGKGMRQPDFRIHGVLSYLSLLSEMNTAESLAAAREIYEREEEAGGFRENPDFYYLRGIFYMKYILSDTAGRLPLLPRIEESFLRCLAIGEAGRISGDVGTGSYKAAYQLGLWHELNGHLEMARRYYAASAREGYALSEKRLSQLR